MVIHEGKNTLDITAGFRQVAKAMNKSGFIMAEEEDKLADEIMRANFE